jgi:dsRNA-specific ribonuclease
MEYVYPPRIQKLDFHESDPFPEPNLEFTPNFFHLIGYLRMAMGANADPSNQQFQVVDPLLVAKEQFRIFKQLEKFRKKAVHVLKELGPWAVEYYTDVSIKQFTGDRRQDILDWRTPEPSRDHLVLLLEKIPLVEPFLEPNEAPLVSEKVSKLIEFLIEQPLGEFSGLVFAEQRAVVFVLEKLLSIHPLTKSRFRCATFVGSLGTGNWKTEVGDLNPKGQETTLDDFRIRRKNLVIATSVLEEGIDISACNVVVCFDKPRNLKSFVQRRGRARKEKSVFVAMLPEGDLDGSFTKWHALEAEMIEAYSDEMRMHSEVAQMENVNEDDERVLNVETTQARLTLESAVSHLEHFCATLPSGNHVNNRPTYSFTEKSGLVSCTVTLPNSLDSSLRRASSNLSWKTERQARKDAAFEAYKALYDAGLVNEHLLPLYSEIQPPLEEIEQRPGIIEAAAQFDPWTTIAQEWDSGAPLHSKELRIMTSTNNNAEVLVQVHMVIPCPVPVFSQKLFVRDSCVYHAVLDDVCDLDGPTEDDVPMLRSTTSLILRSIPRNEAAFGENDFAVLFCPVWRECTTLAEWLDEYSGTARISEALERVRLGGIGLVGRSGEGKSFLLATRDQCGGLELSLRPIPKRRNFLLPGTKLAASQVADQDGEVDLGNHWVPSDDAYFDKLPAKYAMASLVLPSILHRLRVVMTAEEVQQRVLGFSFGNVDLLIAAISAPMALEATNYQRLEFLGDTILKFVTAQSLFAENEKWHEGYLSASKDRMVSNARLAKAALDTGLDRYILTTAFTGRKWKPPLISQLLKNSTQEKRLMSTKLLADVVEAIIGAAYLDHERDYRVAVICIQKFIPEMKTNLFSIHEGSGSNSDISMLPVHLQNLERLVCYTFHDKKNLIEAINHPSCDADIDHGSYQRLEFLGDAVLDMVLVDYLFSHPHEFSEAQMHVLKTAAANKDFLAFLCMEASVEVNTVEMVEMPDKKLTDVVTTGKIYLWQFMRHHSQTVSRSQTITHERHISSRDSIHKSLIEDPVYPWCSLLSLNAEKFFSDIIESLIGAVYRDSSGDIAACKDLAERLGILPYLRRFADQEVEMMMHPKTRLGILAGMKTVQYVKVGAEEEAYGEHGPGCAVIVGGEEVSRVKGGVSREEVEARAAEAAIQVLKGDVEVIMEGT